MRIFSLTLSTFQAIWEAWQWSSPSPQPVQSVHCPVNPQGFRAERVRILGISQRQTTNWLHPLQISSLPWVGQPLHFFQSSWYILLIVHYLEINSMASSFHFWHLIFQARLFKIVNQLSFPNHQETLLALRPFTMYSEPNFILSLLRPFYSKSLSPLTWTTAICPELGLPVSGTVRNKCLLFVSYPTDGTPL